MKSIIKQSFSINLTVMRAFGLYTPLKSTRLYKLHGYIMYLLFVLPLPLLGLIYFLLNEEFEQMDYNVTVLGQLASQIAKVLPFISNSQRIRRCINYFESPIVALNDNQKKMIDRCVAICRRNCRIFFLCVIGSDIFFSTKPIFGGEYVLPLYVWLPFTPRGGSKIYYFTYLFVVMGVVYASLSSAVIDSLIAGLACLAAGQLEVLKDNLQYLSEHAEEEISQKNKSKTSILRDKIKECVYHHNAILTFVNEYEECFSSAVFGQFLGSILVICFCCLQMSKVEPFTFNFFASITLLSTFLVQIYLYCYYGTILFEESNTLTNAVYMGKWYECDLRARKDLIILMERAKKPIIVTAGKVLDLSVVTFTTILRRSYSLLAVMKNR